MQEEISREFTRLERQTKRMRYVIAILCVLVVSALLMARGQQYQTIEGCTVLSVILGK